MHWANPRALILNIEGATDRSCLQNRSWARYKIFTSCRSNFFNSQYNNILLRWILTASFTCHLDYSYAHIYQIKVEYFVIETYHGDILYFSFLRKQQKASVYIHTYSTLCCGAKNLLIFCSLLINIIINIQYQRIGGDSIQ